jgi:hypothetical protein
MTATKSESVTEAGGSEVPRRPSEVRGFQLDFDARRFAESDRASVFSLLTLLRCCCGAASEAGYRVDVVTDESGWRSLRDCAEGDVAQVVRRVERLSDGAWRLPGDPSRPVVDRIDELLGVLVA